MATEALSALVADLTPEQQAAVRAFIEFLQGKPAPPDSPFLQAIGEFMDGHPELLTRLGK
jgi:hypothetical protein